LLAGKVFGRSKFRKSSRSVKAASVKWCFKEKQPITVSELPSSDD
jgi:hypothetical protein